MSFQPLLPSLKILAEKPSLKKKTSETVVLINVFFFFPFGHLFSSPEDHHMDAGKLKQPLHLLPDGSGGCSRGQKRERWARAVQGCVNWWVSWCAVEM